MTTRTSTRRARASLGVVGASVLALTLAACSSGSTTATPSGSGEAIELTTTTPAASVDVESISWALPTGEPRSLDPAKTGDYAANTVVTNLCESLLRLEPDFSTSPGLATEIERVDPVTTVITLRDGVTFWDGSPMTADDVAYSLNRNLDPAVGSFSAAIFRNVASIKATGPLQVTVAFKIPDAAFVASMAGVAGAVMEQAFSEKAGADLGVRGTGVMCTGPFSLGDWQSGSKIVLERYDTYWDTARKARSKSFTFVVFNDDSALTSALRAGEVDGSYSPPVSSLATLSTPEVGTIYYGPSTESYSLGPTASEGPAADPKIRQALDLAIDKNAIISTVLKGTGEPLKTFTPPLVWQGDPAKAVYDAGYAALPETGKPDIEAAKKLVQEAKPSRTEMVLAIPSGSQALLQVRPWHSRRPSRSGSRSPSSSSSRASSVPCSTTRPPRRSGLHRHDRVHRGPGCALLRTCVRLSRCAVQLDELRGPGRDRSHGRGHDRHAIRPFPPRSSWQRRLCTPPRTSRSPWRPRTTGSSSARASLGRLPPSPTSARPGRLSSAAPARVRERIASGATPPARRAA